MSIVILQNLGQLNMNLIIKRKVTVRIDQWLRSELTNGRGPNWPMVKVLIVQRVRIDQGPNCPQNRSELNTVWIVQGSKLSNIR